MIVLFIYKSRKNPSPIILIEAETSSGEKKKNLFKSSRAAPFHKNQQICNLKNSGRPFRQRGAQAFI